MRLKKSKLLIALLFICSCNFDAPENQQLTSNIQESKEKKVFVAEYQPINIKIFDSSLHFPINSIWEEKYWQLTFDKYGNEDSYKIEDSASHTLIFSANSLDSFNIEGNNGRWNLVFENDTLYAGSNNHIINIDLLDNKINDASLFTIYRMRDNYSFKNNTIKLFQFNLKRQYLFVP